MTDLTNARYTQFDSWFTAGVALGPVCLKWPACTGKTTHEVTRYD